MLLQARNMCVSFRRPRRGCLRNDGKKILLDFSPSTLAAALRKYFRLIYFASGTAVPDGCFRKDPATHRVTTWGTDCTTTASERAVGIPAPVRGRVR